MRVNICLTCHELALCKRAALLANPGSIDGACYPAT
jgi:hypothetical protein